MKASMKIVVIGCCIVSVITCLVVWSSTTHLHSYSSYAIGLTKLTDSVIKQSNDFDHSWGAVLSNYHIARESTQLFPMIDVSPSSSFLNEEMITSKKRILIVTNELAGLSHDGKSISSLPHGGAGTANLLLARLLSKTHSVTILHVLFHNIDLKTRQSIGQSFYLSSNVKLLAFPKDVLEVECANNYIVCTSYRVFLYLQNQNQPYDIVHFNDYGGFGYFSTLAKSQKWALQNSQLIVTCHGTSQWASMINNKYPDNVEQLESFFVERKTIELADVLISPSHYILNYYKKRGIVLPKNTYMIPNPQDELIKISNQMTNHQTKAINEICFFGRLEIRKGLLLFAKSIDRILKVIDEKNDQIIITFIGRDTIDQTLGSLKQYLHKNYVKRWLTTRKIKSVKFLDNKTRESAIEYLSEDTRLAVIPSLTDNSPYTVFEAVLHSILFIASDVGGVSEIVHNDDRAKVFFKPTEVGLTKKLLQILSDQSIEKVKPTVTAEHIDQMHLHLTNKVIPSLSLSSNIGQLISQHDFPLISICVTHYERSEMLKSTLLAIVEQTYKNLEVIILDDGSNESHRAVLKELILPIVIDNNWRMLFFENSYLGSARNKCRKYMTGKYLVFFDDDDLPKPNFIERVVQTAEVMNLDIVSTHFQYFPGIFKPSVNPASYFQFNHTIPGWPTHSILFKSEDLIPNAHQIYNHQYILPAIYAFLGQSLLLGTFKNVYGGANLLIRADVYDQLQGFSEYRDIGFEDYELLTRATIAGYKHQLIPDPLYLVRTSAKSMQSSTDSFYNYDRVLTTLANKFTSEKADQDISLMIYYVHGLARSHQNNFAKHNKLIASSVTQFSSEEGQYGWYYGFYRLYANSQDAITYNRSGFIPATALVQKDNVRWELHGPSSNHIHNGKNPFITADHCPICEHHVNWPVISSDHMHPFIANNLSLAAARRWISFYTGNVVIELVLNLASPRECGDGVIYYVLRNGKLIWSVRESDPNVVNTKREISTRISNGESFDFVISAGENDYCDATKFDIVVRKV